MQKLILFLTLISMVHGFKLSNKVKPETSFKFVGDTAPMGYFDPLSFIDNKSEGFLKYAREAELQHSRVAMTSMIVLPLIDNFLTDDKLAINYVSDMPISFQFLLLFSFGYLESERILRNYKNPFSNEVPFTLKDDVEPGAYFGNEPTERLMNVELNNGRLAMIGTVGYIVQELVTRQPVF